MTTPDPDKPTYLLRVTAPHFVAGALFQYRYCYKAAPIIKWMIGLTYSEIQFRTRNKNWTYEWIKNDT